MVSDFIVHVDDSDFEYEVLQYSTRTPVVVDFWAEWCIPCRVLGPKLEALAREGAGRFRLAKLNVDENAKLANHYKVRNIPAVKAFVDGRVVAEFSGVLGEEGLHAFIQHLSPPPEDLLLAKGQNLLALGEYEEAEEALQEFLKTYPNHPIALLGLVRSLLFQGKGREPLRLLQRFPASSVYTTAQFLRPVAEVYADPSSEGTAGEGDLEAAFQNSVRLAKRGNILAALDGFLDILRRDRDFRAGQAKDIYVGWLTLIGDDHPEARQYRQDLSSVLF